MKLPTGRLRRSVPRKTNKGSDRQAPVLVAVESKPVANPEKHQPNRQVKYLKMTVMDGLTSKDINYEIDNTLNSESVALDNHTSQKK